jgi:hypothetical protein
MAAFPTAPASESPAVPPATCASLNFTVDTGGGRYQFHVVVDNGVRYLCMADKSDGCR